MKIQSRICCSLVTFFILSFLLMGMTTRHFLAEGARELENQFLTGCADRVETLVDSRTQWLYDYVRDMAYWDETYELMNSGRDTAQSYFDEDLPDSSLGLDAAFFFREDGTLFCSQPLGRAPLPPSLLEELETVLRENLHGGETAGLLNFPSGPAMVAMSPILTTRMDGPSRGTLALAQLFRRDEAMEVKRLSGLEMDLLPMSEARNKPYLLPIISGLTPQTPFEIKSRGTTPRGYTVLNDMAGKPALLLSLPFPEEILARYRKGIFLWDLGMGSTFLLLLAATFLLLRKVILKRLVIMAGNLEQLAVSPDSGERLPVEGDDEISDLSRHFNFLLDSAQQARNGLLQSEFRYRTIFENSPIALWEEDFTSIRNRLDELRERYGGDGLASCLEKHPEEVRQTACLLHALHLNRRVLEILGAKDRDMLTSNLPSIFREEFVEMGREQLLAIARGDREFEGEGILYTLDRRRIDVHIRWCVTSETDGYGRVLLSLMDITERKNLEGRLRTLSLYDPLTGVNNRNFFENEAARLDSGRFDPLGVVSLDLDGLKLANDFVGHNAGDILLSRTGSLLKRAFRESDLIARVGGDEFVVLLPECSLAGLEKAIKRLREELRLENERVDSPIPLSISVGWAWRENGAPSIAKMLIDADRRMYRQKRRNERPRLENLRQRLEEQLAGNALASAEKDEILLPILDKLREIETG